MKKLSLNKKENKIISITLAAWGIIMIATGLLMAPKEPIIKTSYKVSINEGQVMQFKTNEIKLKDIELEINTPLSVDIKDYLEDYKSIDNSILKSLKLDTSDVNVTQAGKYTYTITYKKKKYTGTVTIKEKELPKVDIKLRNLTLYTDEAVPTELSNYIESPNPIPDEVKQHITLDLSQVRQGKAGNFKYSVSYNGTLYTATIEIKERQKPVIPPGGDNTDPKEDEKPSTDTTTNS